MGFYSTWPSFACMALFLLIVTTPLFSAADSPATQQTGRFRSMDGLRGFLALAVFFHHAAIYHGYAVDRSWNPPSDSRFYTAIGPFSVSLFFMITGYLFWSKLIRDAGSPSWFRLYVGRIFRLVPVYLAVIFFMLAIVFWQTGMKLQVTPLHLAVQLAKWLALGVGQPDVNGFKGTKLLVATVIWSIHWECVFYLCLPLGAWACRGRRMHLSFAAGLLSACLVYSVVRPEHGSRYILAAQLLAGMTCASLHERGLIVRLRDWISSSLVLLLACLLFVFPIQYGPGPLLLLGSIFFLITSGCTVFGLLLTRPAIRLGNVSYGIYLAQGLVLAALFRPSGLQAFAVSSPVQHWCLVAACGMLLISFAVILHVTVERPGIVMGKLVADRLLRRSLGTEEPVLAGFEQKRAS